MMLGFASLGFSPPVQANATHARATVATCDPTADHGCLNGYPYDFAKEFPCGSHGGFQDSGIYTYDSASCCGDGLEYDPSSLYCCGEKVFSYDNGKCNIGAVSPQCVCDSVLTVPTVDELGEDLPLIDTSSPPETGVQCNSKEDDNTGCMNSYQYKLDEYTPCGTYLMGKGTFGCCATKVGLLPYVVGKYGCCKNGDYHEIKPDNGDGACNCKKYGCA